MRCESCSTAWWGGRDEVALLQPVLRRAHLERDLSYFLCQLVKRRLHGENWYLISTEWRCLQLPL
jgi:hypothetical protein